MTIRKHFEPYDFLEKGICVLEYRVDSPIVYVNRPFATFLGTHPDKLEGRSLDEITKAEILHYEAMHPLLVKRSFAISLLGGFCINCFNQAPNASDVIALKVTRVKVRELEGRTFLIGYVRKATQLEEFLNRLKLDTDLSPYIKPIVGFFVAGKWRPILTFTAPLWGPLLAHEIPMLYEFLKNL